MKIEVGDKEDKDLKEIPERNTRENDWRRLEGEEYQVDDWRRGTEGGEEDKEEEEEEEKEKEEKEEDRRRRLKRKI